MKGGYADVNTSIEFYANFTNSTSGEHIENATCIIEFDDAPGTWNNMTDNGADYNYTKTEGFASEGLHSWSVNCSATGYTDLNATDDVQVGEAGGEAVPEFSTVTMLLAMIAVLGVMVLARSGKR